MLHSSALDAEGSDLLLPAPRCSWPLSAHQTIQIFDCRHYGKHESINLKCLSKSVTRFQTAKHAALFFREKDWAGSVR